MERFHTHFGWAIIVSQLTHVFCCGLPVLFSVLSLLSGFGLISITPAFEELHHILHEWESAIFTTSAIILALGWALHFYSRKIDCMKTSTCSHAPCAPKKKRSSYIMVGATALFLINISFFIGLGH